MPTLIAYFIAGACAVGFVTIWFTTAHAELSAKRNCLADLNKQLCLHEELYVQARASPDVLAANGMLETSRMLCREAAKSYNRILQKPMNRIPALLMGFRSVGEEKTSRKRVGPT